MDHALADELEMIAELKIRPGQMDAFLAYTVPNLAISRGYPGNRRFDILMSADQPDTVLFCETWESAEAQRAYMDWRIAAGDLVTLTAFLADQPKFTSLRRIAA